MNDYLMIDNLEDQFDMLPEYTNEENKKINEEIKKIKKEIY